MSEKITQSWIDNIYTQLTTTLANSTHNITSGITDPNIAVGDKILATGTKSINNLIDSIKGLESNFYLQNYADCFTNDETLSSVAQNNKINETTKDQIDSFVNDILDICAHVVTSNPGSSGCTDYINNYREATGCTNCGYFPASGFNHCPYQICTDYGVCSYDPPSGNNNCGFSAASCGKGYENVGNRVGSGCTNANTGTTDTVIARYSNACNAYMNISGFTQRFTPTHGNNFSVSGFNTESNCGFSAGGCIIDNSFSPGSSSFTTNCGFTTGTYHSNFSPCTNFSHDSYRAATGCTDYTNNYIPCPTINTNYRVKISSGTTTTYGNFTV